MMMRCPDTKCNEWGKSKFHHCNGSHTKMPNCRMQPTLSYDCPSCEPVPPDKPDNQKRNEWLLSDEQIKVELRHLSMGYNTELKAIAQAQLDHLITENWKSPEVWEQIRDAAVFLARQDEAKKYEGWVSDEEHQETLQAHEYLIRKEFEGWKSPDELNAAEKRYFNLRAYELDPLAGMQRIQKDEHARTLKAMGKWLKDNHHFFMGNFVAGENFGTLIERLEDGEEPEGVKE
jgi:hypothetical protein